MRKLWPIVFVIVAVIGLGPTPATAEPARTENRLLREFWTYALETPLVENPFHLGTACVPLSGNTILPFATLDGGPLTCTVSAQTSVFVTVINWECSTAEKPTIGATPPQLRACARTLLDGYDIHTLTLDDHAVPQTRVETPPFPVTFPPDNILQTDQPRALSVGAAWVALLPPLSPGQHTIVIHDDGPHVDPVDSTTTIIVH